MPSEPADPPPPPDPLASYRSAFEGLPEEILQRAQASPERFVQLLQGAFARAEEDPRLLARVDKERGLPAEYEPADLVSLTEYPFVLNRRDLRLRKPAADAAREMVAAARADGLTLVFSSAYRSYAYQEGIYERDVREIGQVEADRICARPGHSQHQLGMVVDFGAIDNTFADTRAGRWMAEQAARFGFSLSYPQGAEEITGYSWESWHFRFIGKDAAALQQEYFGLQQYLMLFLEQLGL